MRSERGVRAGVRRLFRIDVLTVNRARDGLRAEVEAHVEARVAWLVARGMSEDAARREAVARFGGNLDAAISELETSAASTARTLSFHDRMDSLAQDLRYVIRGLGRAKTFTAGIVATLALGLGINVGVFRIADRVLNRAPAAVASPRELRRVVMLQANGTAAPAEVATMSFPQAELLVQSGAFARAGLYATAPAFTLPDGRAGAGVYVDSGFFNTLGARAVAGRLFDAAETEPGAGVAVAVISNELWKSGMGSAPIASLPPLRIGEKSYQVIGVAPPDFTGIDLDPVDVWLPLGMAVLGKGTINGVDIPWYRMTMTRPLRMVGRLRPGDNDARVAAVASAGVRNADAQFTSATKGVRLTSIHAGTDADAISARRMLTRLLTVSVLLLIIACANAANLLLARGLRRRRELSVRLALGGARSRIVRLLVLESVTLGIIGGVAAGIAGYWIGNVSRTLVFPGAHWTTSALDVRVMIFTAVIALAAGLAAGLAPAAQLSNPDLVSGLKDNRHQPGRTSHRTRASLIVLQTAFSLCLLVASGLLVDSLLRLNRVDLGFQPEGLITIELRTRGDPFTTGTPSDPVEVAERVSQTRGVRKVALSSNAPFGSHASLGIVKVPGKPDPDIPPMDGPWYSMVSPEFFPVMGMRLVSGRLLTNGDNEGSEPVVVVNQAMAHYYWPDGNAFSSCILVFQSCARVVGIVADVRDYRSGGAAPPRYYLPLAQVRQQPATAIVIRADRQAVPAVLSAIHSIVPAGQRPSIQSIDDRVATAMRPWTVAAQLFTALGIVALLLCAVGVYSVMSYVTSERIPELGLRLVLGATNRQLLAVMMRSGMALVAIGITAGLGAAVLGARLLASLLYGVSPFEPAVYVGAGVALAAVGLIATFIPALHVLRVDPAIALRTE